MINPPKNSSITVLMAEDDIDDQELLTEVLSEIDPSIQLFSFTTGRKFLNYIDNLKDNEIPDLIILDYNIPEINGAEILKYLSQKDRYKPIVKIVWSTSNSAVYEQSCLDLGAYAYMVKPSNISGLKELAREMIGCLNQDLG